MVAALYARLFTGFFAPRPFLEESKRTWILAYVKRMAGAIACMPNLKVLDLEKGKGLGGFLVDDDPAGFVEAMCRCSTLEVLWLYECDLKHAHPVAIGYVFSRCQNLEFVNLQQNCLKDEWIAGLAEALRAEPVKP